MKHPLVKPLAVVRDLVKKCTGRLILGPFMGSGTTGFACALEGREFIGLEHNPEYFKLARSRIKVMGAA
ncbi:MAG: site-specific DNA-methyltransferase [Fimbriimonadaceae bacterium]|nr:site-specific DNA-methyltransferase [Fimbriimonadaceae bacterium]